MKYGSVLLSIQMLRVIFMVSMEPTTMISIVSSEKESFEIPIEYCALSQQLSSLLAMSTSTERTSATILLSSVDSSTLASIIAVMHAYSDRNSKPVKERIISAAQRIPVKAIKSFAIASDFLAFPAGFAFLAAYAHTNVGARIAITNALKKKKLSRSAGLEFARYYYLLNQSLLSILRPQTFECSLQEYLDFIYHDEDDLCEWQTTINNKSINSLEGLANLVKKKPSLTQLTFINNRIPSLNAAAFEHCKNLVHLNLTENNIGTLELRAFAPLTNLETLDLSDNALDFLDEGIFSGLTALRCLFLQNNRITALVNDTFKDLYNLEILLLGCNAIDRLERGALRGATKLFRLDLHSNKIGAQSVNSISAAFNLYSLNLKNNALKDMEKCFESVCMKKLKNLVLSANGVSLLSPSFFEHFPVLASLKLVNNAITQISCPLVRSLSHLTYLDLRNNPLEHELFTALDAIRPDLTIRLLN